MTANVLEEGDTLALDFNKLAKVAEVPGVLPCAGVTLRKLSPGAK
jgi:hypothetical protein